MNMQNDWAKIYSSQYIHQVEIVKALLEDNDIECVIMNKQDSSYFFGEIDLYISNTEIIRAKQIIDNNEIK
jgi:hypothetical protein